MMKKSRKKQLDAFAMKVTQTVGSPKSLFIHTLFFVGIFIFVPLGASLDTVMLVLTTLVSLEAIYLSLLIQMTVNRNTQSLEDVEEDIEDIQEDVEGLEKEVDEISEDLDDIQEEDKKDDAEEKKTKVALKNIEQDLDKLLEDIAALRKNLPGSGTKKYLNG